MSDRTPEFPHLNPPVPIVTAARARDIARVTKSYADQMNELGAIAEARHAERQSQWWLTYAITLAQTDTSA